MHPDQKLFRLEIQQTQQQTWQCLGKNFVQQLKKSMSVNNSTAGHFHSFPEADVDYMSLNSLDTYPINWQTNLTLLSCLWISQEEYDRAWCFTLWKIRESFEKPLWMLVLLLCREQQNFI